MQLVQRIESILQDGHFFFGFEYFPPKTEVALANLFDRMERMAAAGPAYVSITFPAYRNETAINAALASVNFAQNILGLEVMMHLTCTNLAECDLHHIMRAMRKTGCRNVLATRGAPFTPSSIGFEHSVELVRFLQQHYPEMCVAVTAKPFEPSDFVSLKRHGSPSTASPPGGRDALSALSSSGLAAIETLKEKVAAGARIVIMSQCYSTERILTFVRVVREAGIQVPIIPGVMAIHSYAQYRRLVTAGATFPSPISTAIEQSKHDDDVVRTIIRRHLHRVVRRWFVGGVRGIHLYTMNLETDCLKLLRSLDLMEEGSRALPWRLGHGVSSRSSEEVRPIHWANRPKSYTSRTQSWDDYPNGRWGDAKSPAYGDVMPYEFPSATAEECIFRHCVTDADVATVFAQYILGEVGALPWFEHSLSSESSGIVDDLLYLVSHGFLTINSQPSTASAKSTDASIGWGPPNGYIFQKGYVEFFCSRELFDKLQVELRIANALEVSDPATPGGSADVAPFDTESEDDAATPVVKRTQVSHESLPYNVFNFMACGRYGGMVTSSLKQAMGVTWGVFPGRQVMQPTVVDPISFLVWRQEAFDLWYSPYHVTALRSCIPAPPPLKHNSNSGIGGLPTESSLMSRISHISHPIEHGGPVHSTLRTQDPSERFTFSHAFTAGNHADLSSVGVVPPVTPLTPHVNYKSQSEIESLPQVIHNIHDNWLLCCVVSEDFMQPTSTLFDLFRRTIQNHDIKPLFDVQKLKESCTFPSHANDAEASSASQVNLEDTLGNPLRSAARVVAGIDRHRPRFSKRHPIDGSDSDGN